VTLCRRGFPETFPVFRHQGELVWGITARIIKEFLSALTPDDQLSEEDRLEASFRQAAGRLLAAKKIVLCTHMNPDGDGLGCEAALYHALTDLGARVQIANADQTPPRFQFLFDRIPKEAFVEPTEGLGRQCDCFLVVDTGEWKRVGRAEAAAKAAGAKLLVMDHHLSGDMTCEGSLMLARSWFSCTGEMVSRLLSTMGVPMSEPYASPLLASIMYDTGGFRFVGQRNEPFETASYLVRSGARTADMQEAIFASITRQRLDATTRILSSLTYEEGGQFVWAWVDNKLAEETGADRDDIGEVISTMIALSDVKVAALIKEEHRERVKVSLRSKACCPVSSVAQALGGGGHAHACGAVIKGSREGILEQLRTLVREALANSK
jgi:phosphoesterase RecJ-like protein